MSDVSMLPASAKRLYRSPPEVTISNIASPVQKVTATATWQILASDLVPFGNVVIGSIETIGGGYGGTISRRVPLKHPELPSLLATGMKAKCKGFNAATSFWKYCDVEVQFETPAYMLVGQDAFVSRSGSPSTRSLSGTPAGFRQDGIAPPFDPDDDIDGEDIVFTTHQLPTLPMFIYNSVRNCVNASTFLDYPAGTVLYRGPQYNQTAQFDGNQSWEVSHTFSYSKVPWNKYYTPGGVLVNVYRADGSLKYLEAELTAVFL